MQLGKTILNIRKENNLTQDEFAKQFNVTRQTVSNWENEKSYPDLLTLVKISDTFDISLDKMLKEDSKMTRKLNREIKWARYIIRILIVILGILLLLAIGWFIVWNNCKSTVEGKFMEGLEQYEYSVDETCAKGGYYIISYDEDTYFALPNQTMPEFLDFSTDFHAKQVKCYTKLNGEDILIHFNQYGMSNNENIKIIRKDEEGLFTREQILSASERNELLEIIDYGSKLYESVYIQ